jgi:hypothetical protein
MSFPSPSPESDSNWHVSPLIISSSLFRCCCCADAEEEAGGLKDEARGAPFLLLFRGAHPFLLSHMRVVLVLVLVLVLVVVVVLLVVVVVIIIGDGGFRE